VKKILAHDFYKERAVRIENLGGVEPFADAVLLPGHFCRDSAG
jgi:hypothetical protein